MSSNGICFDIGGTVRKALSYYRKDGNPYAGSEDPHSAGNGSLMRLAPVPLFYADNPEIAIHMSGQSSRTTHGAATCIDACRYFAGLLAGAVKGVRKEVLLSAMYSPVENIWCRKPLCQEIGKVASGSFKEKNPPEIAGTGFVVKSLEAALWAFHCSETFKEGCLLAVNLGDDADTTAAIYGQIAGAYYGFDGIPEDWRQSIAHAGLIVGFAERLFEKKVNVPVSALEDTRRG